MASTSNSHVHMSPAGALTSTPKVSRLINARDLLNLLGSADLARVEMEAIKSPLKRRGTQ